MEKKNEKGRGKNNTSGRLPSSSAHDPQRGRKKKTPHTYDLIEKKDDDDDDDDDVGHAPL